MLWTPQKGPLLRESNLGSVGASNYGTLVTTGGAAATKGAAAQLIATTSFDAYKVRVFASEYGLPATASGCCLDILIGSATEAVLIPDLLAGNAGRLEVARRGVKVWEFPLYVPAGSRLSARAAGERTSATLRVGISLVGGNGYPPWRVGQKVTTYGIGTVPNGTPITPGSAAAEGAWTEVAAATSEDHFALIPSFQVLGSTGMALLGYSNDIGVGAATEAEVGGPYIYATDGNEYMEGSVVTEPAWCDIPSGTRLTLRSSCSGTPDAGTQGAIHAMS